MTKSQDLFETAQKSIPGGVNSPVRAFKSVGGTPLFIKSAKGAIQLLNHYYQNAKLLHPAQQPQLPGKPWNT